MQEASEDTPAMACSRGAPSPTCIPCNSQQPGNGERVTKHGATSPSGHARHAPSSARPADEVQGHKEGHGGASGHYHSPGMPNHPHQCPHPAQHTSHWGCWHWLPTMPLLKEGRTCTAPYLSHEVLLKLLLLEGLCPQTVCRGEQGSAQAGLARPPTPASPFPARGARGLQGNSSSMLIPEPAGEASGPLGLGTHHPVSRRCKDHREVGE